MAEEIKLRAERKVGEILPEQITIGTKSHPMTLSDMDISKNQSSKWQIRQLKAVLKGGQ